MLRPDGRRLARLAAAPLLGRRPPVTSGLVRVPGVAPEGIRIRRDAHGVTHVDAATDHDAWFGLGFCHGQDRTTQLELALRVGRGTLAALVGRRGLPADRLSRRVGLRRLAEATLPLLPPDVRAQVEAYADGITAGASLGRRRRPVELALLGARPTPWEPADVLAWGAALALLLPGSWAVELARLQVAAAAGPAAVADLAAGAPGGLPATAPPGAATDGADAAARRLARDLAALGAVVGGSGSNAWAVAADRSATGRPLLAADPHLAPELPPRLHLAAVRCPGWSIAGAAMVGVPAVVAGHDGHLAWGVTLGYVDDADLVVEELGPDRRSVVRGGDVVPCEVRRERIDVRGGRPVVEDVLVTPAGPVIGPAVGEERWTVALRATWLEPRPLRGILGLHRARTAAGVAAAAEDWAAPSQNVVFASADGHIGWRLGAAAPRRRRPGGTVPAVGALEVGPWYDGLVPADELPHVEDPPTGWLASANQRPNPEGGAPDLGDDWVPGWRAARIGEVLGARDRWTPADVAALQLDVASLPWRRLRGPVLAATAGAAGDAALGRSVLAAWDGEVAAGSAGAAVYELLLGELARRVATARAPGAVDEALGATAVGLMAGTALGSRWSTRLVDLLAHDPPAWMGVGRWDPVVAEALAAAVARLRRDRGDDPATWAWGAVRPLVLRHALGGGPLGWLLDRGPFPWGGDTDTVAQAGTAAGDPTRGPSAVAAVRMVVDVGDWDGARWCLAGGQSGDPWSPHYDDQLARWRRGDGVPIAWSPAAVDATTVATLRLVPPGSPG